ncbi:DUF5686 and carboxypeptidase regulatory-like domain-containing protein [Bacteroidales bacterium OttesenSCG-928-A14]|nr:DUF5686 and carboxypeptidase regulatory-like domain-containing protein [Bacteroidales bacterium OttesenSCG-928-A14]
MRKRFYLLGENHIFADQSVSSMRKDKLLLFTLLLFSSFSLLSQRDSTSRAHIVQGVIRENNGILVQYASILVEETQQYVAVNEKGEFSFTLPKGEYKLMIQHISYETKVQAITVPTKGGLDIILTAKVFKLPPVQVSKNKEDPAYRIMRHAIAKAPFYLKQLSEYQATTYGKAIMKVVAMPKYATKLMNLSDEIDISIKKGDIFVRENISEFSLKGDSTNQSVKSVRNSFPEFLDVSGLDYFSLFNIYRESNYLISPVSKQAFSVYHFKLISSVRDENDHLVHQIEVKPKNNNPYAFFGFIYIVESSWHVHYFDLDVNMNYGVAKAFINIKQNFGQLSPSVWMPTTSYHTQRIKIMGIEVSVSMTNSVKYHNFKINEKMVLPVRGKKPKVAEGAKPVSPKVEKINEEIDDMLYKGNLSNREAIKLATLIEKRTALEEKAERDTTKSEYELSGRLDTFERDSLAEERDDAYWDENRQVPLATEEELAFEVKAQHDSVKKANFSDVVAKVKKQKTKKHNLYYGADGLDSYFNFNPVDAVKLMPGFYISGQFKDTTYVRFNGAAGYSFGQEKVIFSSQLAYHYLPEKIASIKLAGGKDSWDFNTESGIKPLGNTLGTLFFKNNAKNFYDRAYVELQHKIEPFNGFSTFFSFGYEWRAELENRSEYAFFFRNRRDYPVNIPDNEYINNDPSLVSGGKGAIMQIRLEYTPKTYYYYSGRQKINTQSGMPTISLVWRKGIPGVFGSKTQFDYLELGVKQRIRFNQMHAFHYHVTGGFFPAKGKMHFSEFKHTQIYVFPLTLGPFFTSFHTQDVYKYASNEWHLSAFFRYESLYLLFKFIPGLNGTLIRENIYLSYSKTPISGNYIELGYSMDRIFALFRVGIFVGFEDFNYSGWNLKLGVDLPF